jgi:hypothetical protein
MIDNESLDTEGASEQQNDPASAGGSVLPRLPLWRRRTVKPASARLASWLLAQAVKGSARGKNGPAGVASRLPAGVVAAQVLRKPSGRCGPSSLGHILPCGCQPFSLPGAGCAWPTAQVTAVRCALGACSPAGALAGCTVSAMSALQQPTLPAPMPTVGRLLRTDADIGASHV